MVKFLEENQSQLSEKVLHGVKERIAFWERELEELYIGVPDVSNDYLKIEAEFSVSGKIKEETVQFYRQDPTGHFAPLDLNEPPFQSEEELVATGYNEMKLFAQSLE